MNGMKKAKKFFVVMICVMACCLLFPGVAVKAETTDVKAEDAVWEESQDFEEQNRKNAVKLEAPTGVQLKKGVYSYSLALVWNINPDATSGYEIEYLCDGEVLNTGYYGSKTSGTASSAVTIKIEDCNRSGNYSIRVRCKATKSYLASDWVTVSEIFRYDVPDAVLDAPSDLNWNGTTISWNAVDGADGYRVRLYRDGKWLFNVWGTMESCSRDLSAQMKEDGIYTAEVQSISADINDIRSSAFVTSQPCLVGQKVIVREFVSRLYRLILNREADEEGLEAWTSQLIDKTADGAQIVAGCVGSDEFIGRNLSNEEIVEIMYQAMLGRSSDESGKAAWGKILENGCSTYYLVNGFSGSQEFGEICAEYGINAGTVELDNPRDINPDLTGFVTRCYVQSLGRTPDVDGLNDWCYQLLNGEDTPKNVAYGFVFSPESVDKGLSDSDYIDMLYRLCMDREADPEGKAGWLNSLKEETREQVFWGFANSNEFEEIIAEYGLN